MDVLDGSGEDVSFGGLGEGGQRKGERERERGQRLTGAPGMTLPSVSMPRVHLPGYWRSVRVVGEAMLVIARDTVAAAERRNCMLAILGELVLGGSLW